MNDDLQFYPTPPSLSRRVWDKFQNREFTRVLDPVAGEGAMLDENPWTREYHRRSMPVDCVEIDVSKHATLRSKGYNVVGLDFMNFKNGAVYSHILLNPPFKVGARIVLKAWDMAFNAEIAAIVNAETIRNPHTQEREMLAKLIAEHGHVEFVSNAFNGPDSVRKTDVEIAIVYLKKTADTANIIGDLLGELREDVIDGERLAGDYREQNAITLPTSFIENSVVAFRAAVSAMRDSVMMQAREHYYTSLLGETMAVRCGDGGTTKADISLAWVQEKMGKQYDELKDRAWSGILRSSNVTSRLSSKAQQRVESEFEQIKKLDYTIANIYGFLYGIVSQQGQIQLDMCLDCFDTITKYHTENAVWIKGWKSNDRHSRGARRIRTTRFILPGHRTESYHNSMPWDTQRLLADFDRVFSMLDGKLEPDLSLVQACDQNFHALRCGTRIASSYFDLRYWPGAGTLHFFPKSAKLVDRLNRLVGTHRGWLPQPGERVSEDFWLMWDKAEKFDKEFRAELAKGRRHFYSDPLWQVTRDGSDHEAEQAADAIDAALETVLQRHGINTNFQIEHKPQQDQLLLAA